MEHPHLLPAECGSLCRRDRQPDLANCRVTGLFTPRNRFRQHRDSGVACVEDNSQWSDRSCEERSQIVPSSDKPRKDNSGSAWSKERDREHQRAIKLRYGRYAMRMSFKAATKGPAFRRIVVGKYKVSGNWMAPDKRLAFRSLVTIVRGNIYELRSAATTVL